MKYRSKCVWKSGNQRIREVLIAKYVSDILFHVSPCILTENIMLQFLKKKNVEFKQLLKDII